MSRWRPYCLGSIAAFGISILNAQDVQRPGSEQAGERVDTLIRQNAAGIFLERNLNTFNWTGRAALDTAVAGNSFKLTEQYTSNVILLEGTPSVAAKNLESSQQQISLLTGRTLTNNLKAQAQWSSLGYSDNKAVGLSNTSFYSLLGGFEYDPYTFVSVSPMAGYRWDNQFDIHDKGFSYNISAQTRGISLDGYDISGTARFAEDRLDPRLLQNHFARVSTQKTFVGNTRDSLEIGWSRNRRDFYTAGTSKIESRIDNGFSFANLLDYEFGRNLLASMFISILSRNLDKDVRRSSTTRDTTVQFNTAIDEFRLETFAQGAYRNDDGKPIATVRFYHGERTENHTAKPIPGASPEVEALFGLQNKQEQTKNNTSRRTALSGALEATLSRSDTASVSGTASILRYDTPSSTNVEDRDELLVALSLVTSHRVSQYLDIAFALSGNLTHIVYLLKERSANNNYNRVLRFAPRVTYRPLRELSTFNAFEVLANYTVYDFEQQLSQVRSFSYRQFGWLDSTSVELTHRIGLDFLVYLKLYERGQLQWTEFRERRENSFVDKTYAGQLRFKPSEDLLMAVGLRYFSQSRYSYKEEVKNLDSFLRSIGPTCSIAWEISSYSHFGIRGWYEHRRQTDGSTRSLANMAMSILLTF
jgi:hypothetical protein